MELETKCIKQAFRVLCIGDDAGTGAPLCWGRALPAESILGFKFEDGNLVLLRLSQQTGPWETAAPRHLPIWGVTHKGRNGYYLPPTEFR